MNNNLLKSYFLKNQFNLLKVKLKSILKGKLSVQNIFLLNHY